MSGRLPHVYTLTGNLLAEDTFQFVDWSPGRTQRATGTSFQVGGKEINVSKMLNRLGVSNTALCFTGGTSGMDCVTWLRKNAFACVAFPAEIPTRRGLVVRSEQKAETTFLGPDAPLDAAAALACATYLDAQPDGHVLALCGSVPGWNRPGCDPLRAALERWQNRGTLVADTYGEALGWLAHRPLALVKINRQEFDALFTQLKISADIETRLNYALAQWPARAWIVTDGPREVWWCEKGHSPSRITPPAVQEISPTGSGDVFFAALLHSLYLRQTTVSAAIASALPYAAANAAHPGIAEFPLS